MKQKNIEKYKENYCQKCVHLEECEKEGFSDELIKKCNGGYKW